MNTPSKSHRFLVFIVVVAVVIVALVLIKRNLSAPSEPAPSLSAVEKPSIVAAELSASAELEKIKQEAQAESKFKPVEKELVTVPPVVSAVIEESAPQKIEPQPNQIVLKGESFSVKSDMVFAKVGTTEITLKDLVPVNQAVLVEQTMSAAEFQKLLQQAIDRELVFQAARARNLQLDEEQKHVLEKARLRAGAAGFSLPANERQAYEDKSNFDSKDLMGSMFADSLAKAAGGPDKASATEADYQKYLRTMFDDMRSKANVVENVVLEK